MAVMRMAESRYRANGHMLGASCGEWCNQVGGRGYARMDDMRATAPASVRLSAAARFGDLVASGLGQALARLFPAALPAMNGHADQRIIMRWRNARYSAMQGVSAGLSGRRHRLDQVP